MTRKLNDNVKEMWPEHYVAPSKNRKEHKERTEKCYDFPPLKDGQRVMWATPAFDFRGGEDDNYGQHGVELHFAKRKGRKVVSFTVFTGWSVSGQRTIMDGEDISFMSPGLYTHYKFKKDTPKYIREYGKHEECPFLKNGCWGELGSGLYSDVVMNRLVNEGSFGVWDEIEKELDSNDSESN
jgi:hypothetical protein